MPQEHPDFEVLEIGPGPRTALWTYASVGLCEMVPSDWSKLEFFLLAPSQSERHVEMVTMVAWYHLKEHLGWAHTFEISEPWLPGSSCDCMLVSKPYPFGEDLEIVNLEDSHCHILWLLPITQSEREFAKSEGLEALEQRFDDGRLEYWLPTRTSLA